MKLTLNFRSIANFNSYHVLLLVLNYCIGVRDKMTIMFYFSDICGSFITKCWHFKSSKFLRGGGDLKMYTLIVAHKIRCIILFHFEYIMTGFMNSNAKLHGYLRKLFHPVSLKSENATK